MKSRAAVAFKAGEPLQIVEIDVAPPQKGEVLIRITDTGVGDLHQHFAFLRGRNVDLDDLQGFSGFEGNGGAGFHGVVLSVSRGRRFI